MAGPVREQDGVNLRAVLAQVRNDIDIAVEDRGSRWLICQAAKRVQHPNQLPLVTLPFRLMNNIS